MKYIIILLSTFITLFFFKYIYDAGVFKKIYQQGYYKSLTCTKKGDMRGPEDLAHVDHHLFISSGYHKPFFKNDSNEGALYYIDLKSEEHLTVKLDFPKKFYFNPHGIDAIDIGEGKVSILAINHRKSQDTIEEFIFDTSSRQIIHVKTIENSSGFKYLNDVAIVDTKSFFVSEESKYKQVWLRNVFKYMRIGTGRLHYFEDYKLTKSFGSYFYTNGLAYNKEQSKLYVSEMLALKVSVFSWSAQNLKKERSFNMDGGPDNLYYSYDQKKLFVATHPKIFSLKKHSENANSVSSPSQLEVIDLQSNKVQTTLSTSEPEWSAASIFLPYKGKLILGNIFKTGLQICKIPKKLDL